MKAIYGILNSDGIHTDVSNTLQGAKKYATLHGYKKVSKRVGYNAQLVALKKYGQWVNQIRYLKNIDIYDNGGKTIDSITFVFLDSKESDIFGSRFYNYECLCTSYTGRAFWQHSNCQKGRHLGKKITFNDLNSELKESIENYLIK